VCGIAVNLEGVHARVFRRHMAVVEVVLLLWLRRQVVVGWRHHRPAKVFVETHAKGARARLTCGLLSCIRGRRHSHAQDGLAHVAVMSAHYVLCAVGGSCDKVLSGRPVDLQPRTGFGDASLPGVRVVLRGGSTRPRLAKVGLHIRASKLCAKVGVLAHGKGQRSRPHLRAAAGIGLHHEAAAIAGM